MESISAQTSPDDDAAERTTMAIRVDPWARIVLIRKEIVLMAVRLAR